jgi:hypothetical protein
VAVVLGDAHLDRLLGALKLRPRLEQIERGVERRRARRIARRVKISAP